jgi:hypothetical protein
MAEAARLGLSTNSEPPIEMRLSSLGATQQGQPDHPQPSTSPSVQDQPASPSVVQLQRRATMMTGGSAGMTVADATSTSTSDPPAPHVAPPEARVVQIRTRSRVSAEGSVKKAKSRRARTKVGRAVLKNAGEIKLIGTCLIGLIDDRLESLQTPQNSDQARAAVEAAIADYEDLRARVEAFLGVASQFIAKKAGEEAITEKTYSLVEGLRNWWSKRHLEICEKVFSRALGVADVALFGVVLHMCSQAGADPNLSVGIPGAWFGGEAVADVIKAWVSGNRNRHKKNRR